MTKHKKKSSISDTDYSFKAHTNFQSSKSLQTDKTYDGIRGHEKHILFHFFTLFMISFFVGVLLIHLSLWMNGHLISAKQSCNSHSIDHDDDSTSDKKVSAAYNNEAQQASRVNLFQKAAWHYTGYYFQGGSHNVTTNNLFE